MDRNLSDQLLAGPEIEISHLLAFVVLFHVVDQLENFANCFGLII